jgi:hypothetical protein
MVGGKRLESDLAGVAENNETLAQSLLAGPADLQNGRQQGRAADVGSPLVAQGKRIAGEVTRGVEQIIVGERREVGAQDRRLFEPFGGRTDPFGRLNKAGQSAGARGGRRAARGGGP